MPTRTVEKPRKKPGAPRQEAIRWTINMAAREFGVHREQLERRRRELGIEPDENGYFTSRQIAQMLFGDKEKEEIGLTAARRIEVEMRNRQADGELVPVERAAILGERYVTAVRQIILNSKLSDVEKGEALGEIVQLKDVDWSHEAREASKK